MTSEGREDVIQRFLTDIWGDVEGYVYLPVKSEQGVRKFFLKWPEKRDAAVRHILKYSDLEDTEVFFSPAIFERMQAKKEAVKGASVAWVDFDGNFPEEWSDHLPTPHIEVQSSSAKRRHTYWKLDTFVGPEDVETINRALAYGLDADMSGWDAGQFLRPPMTKNRKYLEPIETKIVADRENATYSTDEFLSLPMPASHVKKDLELGDLPPIDQVKAEADWSEEQYELFETSAADAKRQHFDRSGALQRLAYLGVEQGWKDEQIYVALVDADDRWKKYQGRDPYKRSKILIDLINRAHDHTEFVGETGQLVAAILGEPVKEVPEPDAPDPEENLWTLGQIAEQPDIDDWVIRDLMTSKGFGLITGHSGTGKTQFILQLGADLATGCPSKAGLNIEKADRRILFLSLEMDALSLKYFIRPLLSRYPALKTSDRFVVYPGKNLSLKSREGRTQMLHLIKKTRPDVILVDSLTKAAGSDINSNEEMTGLMNFLSDVRETASCGMIFIHHHRKKANDAQSKRQVNTMDDIYGSYVVTSQVDFAIDLERSRGEDGKGEPNPNIVDMKYLKVRLGPDQPKVQLHRNSELEFSRDLGNLQGDGSFDPPGGLTI